MAKIGKRTSTRSADLGAALDPALCRRIQRGLLAWYRRARRDLPWRKTRDPYAIWVSEVMLQQTQVATVIPYYERWMRRFPNLRALAGADEHDVLHAWQGLGYYSRARALRDGAARVHRDHAGRMPESAAELARLPGIGPYTAGAISSIAFGERAPVVDGNVVRVLCRLLARAGDPTRAPLRKELWRIAAELVPERDAGDFNQALMELGATVCTVRAPDCEECPLRGACRARAAGDVEGYPSARKRPATSSLRMSAALVPRGDALLVVRLPLDAARWAGMWQFPSAELAAGESAEHAAARAARELGGMEVAVRERLTLVRHGVTRYRVTLEAFRCRAQSGRLKRGARWQPVDELEALALPAAQRRLAAAWRRHRSAAE